MLKRCVDFECRENYSGEPNTRTVTFPKKEEDRNMWWIDAMPNDRETLLNRK